MHKRKKVPLILQVEQGEGGAAALAMMLQYWGKTIALEQLILDCGAVNRLTNAADLVQTATKYGLYAAGYQVGLTQLEELPLPVIAHWKQAHFVVIAARKKQGYIIHDPACGARFVSFSEMKAAFSGVVLHMQPAETFVADAQIHPLRSIVQHMARYSASATGSVILCSVLIWILHLVNSVYIQLMVNRFMENTAAAAGLLAGMLAVQAVAQLLLYKLQRVICHMIADETRLQWESKHDRSEIPITFLTLRGAYFIEDLLERGANGLRVLAEEIVPKALSICGVVFYVLLMIGYSLPLTGLLVGLLFVWWLVRKVGNPATDRERSDMTAAKVVDATMQALQVPDIAQTDAYGQRRAAYFHRFLNQKKHEVCQTDIVLFVVSLVLLSIGSVAGMTYGMVSFRKMMAFLYLAILVLYSMVQAQALRRRTDTLETLLLQSNALFPTKTPQIFEEVAVTGALEWKNVCYRPYETGAELLHRVSFQLWQGITAVVGDGHHLFSALCMGHKRITAGTIYYGDISLRKLSFEMLDDTVVSLDGNIAQPEMSIAAFLCGRATNHTEESYLKLAKDLGLHTFVLEAGGYQANLSTLSSGAQILASIERAILAQPKLLILEQLLQNLDETQEQIVLQEIQKQKINCVILTNPDSLPEQVNRVIELQNGNLEFHGTLDEFRAKVGVI